MKRSLHIDIETYCETDLKKAGAYKYAESAEIILFAYAYDNDPVVVVDLLSGEFVPDSVMDDLVNENVVKKAFNAAFERAVMRHYFNMELPVEQWEDTQALAALCGLPLNLQQAAEVLKIDKQKEKGGRALITFFCTPVKKPIKKNNFRTRNYPQHNIEKWQQFKDYNGKDVDAERAVCRALSFYKISDFEKRQWALDQQINERGVAINVPFVRKAVSLINNYEEGLLQEFKDITGIDKPTELGKLKKWLFEEDGEEVDKLNKDTIPAILQGTDSNRIRRALEIRQESSKTSTKKYITMMSALGEGGRVRGLHEYCGANRTARAAGRLLQHQNLPRGTFKNIEPVRDSVMSNDPAWLEFSYGAIPDTLSSLIRSALIPAPKHRFIIVDYVSIEAIILAALANEKWVIDLFKQEGKPKMYEATAAMMFNLKLEDINPDLRQKGKVATLSCGYQGGVGALIKMGALKEGLTEEELPKIVKDWRAANPNIVNFWYTLQKAAVQAIQTRQKIYVHELVSRDGYSAPDFGLSFHMVGNSLFFTMPSGRPIVYVNASLEEGEYGPKIIYWGIDQIKKRWTKLDTYSGKLAENATQSVARDILMNGLQHLDKAGYRTVLHVHDEAVCEMPEGVGSLAEMSELMLRLPDWASSIPLKAAGEESFYYKK